MSPCTKVVSTTVSIKKERSEFLIFSLSLVEPGHRAFKFNKVLGVGEAIFREGWHFKLPYLEKPVIYDVRTHPRVIKSVTGSKGNVFATLQKDNVGL